MLNIVLSIVCGILLFLAGYVLVIGSKAIHNNLNELRQIRTRRFLEFSDYKKMIALHIGVIIDIAGILGMLYGVWRLWR